MASFQPPTYASLKRKRSSSVRSFSATPSQSRLPSDSINPHSHPPSLLRQFAVAGLPDTSTLPSTKDFPNRRLPPYPPSTANPRASTPGDAWASRDDDEDDDDDEANSNAGSDYAHRGGPSSTAAALQHQRAADRARQTQERHVGPLRAVILRSLERGDIERAKRAFGLVLRTEVDGKRVDLRSEHWWALGAEILMREGEPRSSRMGLPPNVALGRGEGDDDDDSMDHERDGGIAEEDAKTPRHYRWGTPAGAARVKTYYMDLIQLYPYDRLRPGRVDALTFWPAMAGVEIYDIWIETKAALQRAEEEAEAEGFDAYLDEPPDPHREVDLSDSDASDHRLTARQAHGGHLRQRKEAIRTTSLAAVRDLAKRLDLVMETTPFKTSHEMLRLRGMVALYAGDLSMATLPCSGREEREGVARRDDERERARERFARVERDGGWLEGWVEGVLFPERKRMREERRSIMAQSEPGYWGDGPVFSSLPTRNKG